MSPWWIVVRAPLRLVVLTAAAGLVLAAMAGVVCEAGAERLEDLDARLR